MRGVCFQSIGMVEYIELDDPVIEQPTDAIVAVEMAGLCGSDLHPFFGREVGLDAGTVMGHEFVGRVIEVGSAVTGLRIGDRVFSPFSTNCGNCFYCNMGLTSRCTRGQLFGWRSDGIGLHGAQAERVRVPLADATLKRLPEGLSNESALLLGDNLSTGYFCASMAGIDSQSLVVVIGCGTVGLLAIQAARKLGAAKILAVDLIAERRARALQLGVNALEPTEEAIRWVREATQGRGADCVMELVGLPAAQRFAYEVVRPGGVLSVIGCHSSPSFAFTPAQAYDKNLTYRTGRCPARHYMNELTNAVLDQLWDIDQLITHRFDPADCKRAYEIFGNQQDGCIKGLFVFE